MVQGHWDLRVLGRYLLRQGMRCWGDDHGLHANSRMVYDLQKCGPVEGTNSLDAEVGGCAMLMESLNKWLLERGSLH